jgi:hypothetical protein
MLLRAVQRLAPSDIHIDLYRVLGALPPFNPDLEALGRPAAVAVLRSRIIYQRGRRLPLDAEVA